MLRIVSFCYAYASTYVTVLLTTAIFLSSAEVSSRRAETTEGESY